MKMFFSYSNIVRFTEEIYLSFQELAKEKEISYHFIKSTEKLFIYFDEDQLKSVLSTLLTNAFKFTPYNGKISMQITRKGNWVNIQVIDSGKGIDQKNADKLFNDFFQLKTVNNDNYENSLANCKAIIDSHNGRIDFVSDTASSGSFTMFTISLQLGDKHLDKMLLMPKYNAKFYDN